VKGRERQLKAAKGRERQVRAAKGRKGSKDQMREKKDDGR